MNKTDYNKKLFSLISIFASIFVYVGAIAIYFYANGWRLGNINQLFIKTGVLTVESDPLSADLYIEGEEKGRTPKSLSLPVGNYTISLYKSGYMEWIKSVEVKEQKSTPVYPWLIKERIEKKEEFKLQDKKYINSWSDKDGDHIYFLVNEYLPVISTYRYSLYRFDTNTAFWNMSSNPRVVLTFDYVSQPGVEILLSPNGLLGLLTIVNDTGIKYYLLDSSKSSTLDTLVELNLSVLSDYEMSWAQNNQYLMFESQTDLISFDITKQTRYLLIKKVADTEYLWSTDEQGFFYRIEYNENQIENENVYSYLLIQRQMDGSSPKTIIEDLYFQKDTDYIFRYREDTGDGKYAPFTNSPESTKSVGKLKDFMVSQKSNGVFLKTETSTYWYNTETKKYYLVSAYPADLLQFAYDNYKLLYKDEQGYGVFTFKKEDGDHTVSIGSKLLKDMNSGINNISWLTNSQNLSYIKEKTMYITDKDGDNKTKILDSTDFNLYHVINSSGEKLITLSIGEETENQSRPIYINSYIIH